MDQQKIEWSASRCKHSRPPWVGRALGAKSALSRKQLSWPPPFQSCWRKVEASVSFWWCGGRNENEWDKDFSSVLWWAGKRPILLNIAQYYTILHNITRAVPVTRSLLHHAACDRIVPLRWLQVVAVAAATARSTRQSESPAPTVCRSRWFGRQLRDSDSPSGEDGQPRPRPRQQWLEAETAKKYYLNWAQTGTSTCHQVQTMRFESHLKSYFGNVKAFNLKKFKIIAEPVAAMAGGGP